MLPNRLGGYKTRLQPFPRAHILLLLLLFFFLLLLAFKHSKQSTR
jgi:hypothetical protein